MKKNIFFTLLLFFIFISCSSSEPKIAKLKTNKIVDFGTISLNDTITHVFEIENISDVELKISEIGLSCGCTGATISDSIIKKHEISQLKVQYIPRKEQLGKVNNSIVIEANTNPPFTVLYLNGFLKE